MDYVNNVLDYLLSHKLLFSVIIVGFILLIRRSALALIRGDGAFITEKQRKWMSQTKNGTFATLLVIGFFLWKEEINEFALSVTAIAVAIVVASKEIILCFTGSIQRASSRSFRIGDWIEVGSLCGEVIEHNMMATVIQEIDLGGGLYHYTGKTATLPNSMFFTYPVKNLNFMKRYVFHNFEIVVRDFVNLYTILPQFRKRIEVHFEHFIEVARRYNLMIEKHAGVDLPGADPVIHISSTATGEQKVHVMIFCPTERAHELEQLIRADFMAVYDEHFSHQGERNQLHDVSDIT
ncbi:Mechanosensitive ion channel [Vibrio ruber DSM 16370]|uniref:Mechanosensitive ion channel n=1 Tax=Vibrio ruber (strain DSM 16370 / JCM 11486 / BCRC 17186 / CECT 7878 / LMG 23124 / VR1) TaxID=1123498 RepID=A0A1R4LR77_VIBR1|nr:mechanosensitive ion channel family protein [Vibrio ruber]SJN59025.1 Mechanosensitive ion channel [Vibrio ruber DSM 16370]